MSVFDDIIRDHERFINLIDEMQGRNTTRREDQMRILTDRLRAHMRAEEQTIYENAKNERKELSDMALVQYEQHHVCDLLLDELQDTEMNNDIWNAKLLVFRQILESHFNLEENDVLPALEEMFPRERLIVMADDFSAIERNIELRR